MNNTQFVIFCKLGVLNLLRSANERAMSALLNPIKTFLNRLTRLNRAQIKFLSVFSVFAIIGFGPVSPGCLIGLYIVAKRPLWFMALIDQMYADAPLNQTERRADTAEQTQKMRIKCFLGLLGLFIVDIAPVPVTPTIAFYIILTRPERFYRMVLSVYGR